MKFVFEIKKLDDKTSYRTETLDLVRKMMLSFEVMLNTVIPEFRIHLREED